MVPEYSEGGLWGLNLLADWSLVRDCLAGDVASGAAKVNS